MMPWLASALKLPARFTQPRCSAAQLLSRARAAPSRVQVLVRKQAQNLLDAFQINVVF